MKKDILFVSLTLTGTNLMFCIGQECNFLV
jgi:hypothetical protein